MAEMSRTLIGESAPMRAVRGRVADLATADGPVLIVGERGTGKASTALALHHASRRCDGPLLSVDCAALGDDDLHLELFGQTGVEPCRTGRLASARGGTVVLREAGTLGPATRDALSKLLASSADVRIVATTAHELSPALEQWDAETIAIPPLRERPEDVADLCRHFVAIAARRERRRSWEPDPVTLGLFRHYAWPLNVREMRTYVDRAYAVSGPENPLRAALVEPWLRAAASDPVAATVDALAGKPLADIEKQIILSTLQQFRGHRLKTAGALGIGVRTLGIKLKRWKDEGEPVVAPERAAS